MTAAHSTDDHDVPVRLVDDDAGDGGAGGGANAMTMPNTPMAVPRRSMGNVHMSTVITSGMRMPAPAAWIKRPASSTGKFGSPGRQHCAGGE